MGPSGRGPTGLQARVRKRGRLENRGHVVPKTEFQDGGDRTQIFTHKIIILAYLMTWYINSLAWRQRIISLVCFANNAIHPWPQWYRYSTEKCLPDSHLTFIYIVILSISPIWRIGETNPSTKTFKILFSIVMPTFGKSCRRPWPGPGPTRLRTRARNRDRLENRSHVVPKTEFQDGGGRTRIFTHKITILA